MSANRSFLDTNVFFYSVDPRDPIKQQKARALIEQLRKAGEGFVSAQVYQEFAANVIKKLAHTPEHTTILCEVFAGCQLVRPDLDLIHDALNLMTSTSISFWDACIVAAAKRAGCKTLYSEDLNSGQHLAGIRVVNPFQ